MKLKSSMFIKIIALALSTCLIRCDAFAAFGDRTADGVKSATPCFSVGVEAAVLGGALLHSAIYERDYTRIIELISSNPSSVNQKDYHGETPLNAAIRVGDYKMVVLLVEHGAKIDKRGSCGERPLHVASLLDKLDIVRYLVERGADFNKADKDGNTPLHFAVCGQAKRVLPYLMSLKPELNVANNNGETPLHMAVKLKNNPQFAEMLINGGADSRLPDHSKKKRTAFDIANDPFYRNPVVIKALCSTPVGVIV